MPHHFLNDLRSVLETQASRPAIIHRDRTIVYGELEKLAASFAGFLQASGLVSGDRVVLFTENKLPFLVAHLGVVFAGGVPLPLNPRFTREEMRYFLTDSECRVVIAGDEQRGSHRIACLGTGVPAACRVRLDRVESARECVPRALARDRRRVLDAL